MFIGGLLARTVQSFSRLKKNGKVSAAVFVDTVGVGLISPISLLYFTLSTHISVGQIGLCLTLATLVSLPFGLLGGWIVDRFGAKSSMVINNVVSGMGYLLYIFAHDISGIFIALLVVSAADRLYWASWSSYVESFSEGRPFEVWFSFLESVKAAAMGIGALIGMVLLAPGGILFANIVVLLNVFTCFFSAVMFLLQPISLQVVSDDAKGEPEIVAAIRGFRDVLRDKSSVFITLGTFFLSPIMLLPNAAISVLLVTRWGMPASVASILFALNLVVVALMQTSITRWVQYFSRSRIIWVAALCVVATVVPLMLLDRPDPMAGWVYVVFAGIVLGIVDALYLPATNALMVIIPPVSRQGRSVAVFQTASAVGMALFPLALFLLSGPGHWLVWAGVGVSVCMGALFFACALRGAPSSARYPEQKAA